MKLYITGNGFDLHHRLDTSYCSFGCFLKSHQYESYKHLVEFAGFTELPDECTQVDNKEHPLWSHFESSLAELDTQAILDAFTDYLPDLGSPDFHDREWHTFDIEMQRILASLTDELYTQFALFISQVNYPKSINDQKLQIFSDALFINFNYTNTIEYYYDINKDNILYIHGNASLPGDELILGHGIDPKNFEEQPEQQPTGATEEELEQWNQYMSDNYDFAYESGKQTINRYFTHSFKNTAKVIADSKAFFSQLSMVNEVIIIGHSLSSVDMPYFAAIKQHVQPDTTWSATWYLDTEHQHHLKALRSIGIEPTRLMPIKSLLALP